MSKVFAIQQGFIGTAEGVDIELVKGALYDSNDPAVKAAPSLFAPVAESTDAEVKNLKAEIEELKALMAAQVKPEPVTKPAAKKTTQTAGKAADTELKGEVA